MALFDLTGKQALVTGGSVGIGRACAIALALAGADVAITGRNEEAGERTSTELRALGRNAFFVRCDVSKEHEVDAMVRAVAQHFGRLDIAVNNAGIYRAGNDESQSAEDWNEVIGVNLTGTWLCARAEMRQMIAQTPTGGKIINVASIAASVACSNGSYDASKAAIVQLTRTLASRWGAYNINVNSISPGHVISAPGKTRSLEERQKLRELTPLGYAQRAQDLYGPIVFLASRASDYVTGHDLVVDGGYTLSRWMQPLSRSVPPRVDSNAEVVEVNKDLSIRGAAHDAKGIALD